ncbi:MATE family efflux transporter [Fulvivirgaceae bacterium BMA10]|uniref:Multidrug-efflux transporter n=1 Tax=Splendidivirga corallicola TaxID=3051826 RepID=A0ABT8KRP7_9BACT|nr:MATE family efflux transporter [Fulvivirgaceae bacterium BMA10]
MTYRQHFKKNITLAYPVMLSQFGHVMVGVADSVMVGRVGVESLAAASLANSIFHLLMMFGIGISYAITPLVAQADGENDYKKSGNLLKHGLLANSFSGLTLVVIITSSTFILHYLNQPAEVVKLAIPYLGIIGLSIFPFMLFQTFRQFAEGLSLTRQAMYVTIGANVINIALNYVLIFGKLGFDPMGLNGAGLATLISRILMVILMGSFIYFAPRFRPYLKGLQFKNFEKKIVRKLLGIGVPVGLQFIFEVGAFAFAAIMAGWLGADALAAHQIAISMVSISYMTASGISAAATIRVGNQLGMKDIFTMRRAGFTTFIMAGIFMTACGLIFITLNDFLPTLYIDDQQVIRVASSLLIIAAFFQISDGIQVVGLGALRGMADVKMPTIITLVAYWVLGLPIAYLLGFILDFGMEGIWYGLLIGLSVAAILLFTRFSYISKKLLLKSAVV